MSRPAGGVKGAEPHMVFSPSCPLGRMGEGWSFSLLPSPLMFSSCYHIFLYPTQGRKQCFIYTTVQNVSTTQHVNRLQSLNMSNQIHFWNHSYIKNWYTIQQHIFHSKMIFNNKGFKINTLFCFLSLLMLIRHSTELFTHLVWGVQGSEEAKPLKSSQVWQHPRPCFGVGSSELAEVFTHIFNMSLSQSSVPTSFKATKPPIFPLYSLLLWRSVFTFPHQEDQPRLFRPPAVWT